MKITEDLLLRYHLDECSPEERKAVELWLESEAVDTSEVDRHEQTNLDSVWKQLAPTIQGRPKSLPLIPFRHLGWAAGFLFFLGLVYFSYKGLFNDLISTEIQLAVEAGKQQTVFLEDGSKIVLNSSSSLRYPSRFSFFNRRMEMEFGEAHFTVAKDRSRPFVLKLGQSEVTVLGTEFNIENQRESDKQIITLTEGSIRFTHDSLAHTLVAGDQLTFYKSSGKLEVLHLKNTDRVTAWQDGVLWFDDMPLTEVLGELERRFGAAFIYDTPLDRRFTGKFKDESFQQILNLIGSSSGIRFRKTPHGIEVQETHPR